MPAEIAKKYAALLIAIREEQDHLIVQDLLELKRYFVEKCASFAKKKTKTPLDIPKHFTALDTWYKGLLQLHENRWKPTDPPPLPVPGGARPAGPALSGSMGNAPPQTG